MSTIKVRTPRIIVLAKFAQCEYYEYMRVISKPKLHHFWDQHAQAKRPLEAWYGIVKKASWRNLAELKSGFPAADQVGRCTVFDIRGNKYRLIARVNYRAQIVYVGFVLTHEEYDANGWKSDCSAR